MATNHREAAGADASGWHPVEYAIEGALLGLFMVSAAAVTTAVTLPASPVARAVSDPTLRRALIGLAMGATAAALIYSPWGQRSGAHMNPAVTLTYWRLGKVRGRDAMGYVAAQVLGAVTGVLAMQLVLGAAFLDPAVNRVATLPGPAGPTVAFAAEIAISFGLMLAVLAASNHPRLTRSTGLVAAALVATWILVEAPLSGMSMNPARSFAPALSGRLWTALWVYLLAPPIGMLAAAEAYLALRGAEQVYCAKLVHPEAGPCPFRCRYGELRTEHACATATARGDAS